MLDLLPVCNRGFAQAIQAGKIIIRSSLEQINHTGVSFKDEVNPESFDQIIFATGYSKNLPFLPKEYGDLDDPDFLPDFLIFHPREPGLIFLPRLEILQGGWPLIYAQAKAIAAYFRAEKYQPARFQDFQHRRNCPPNQPSHENWGRPNQAA